MVLAKTEILKEIASGKLKIEPFQEAALHACAYDLALSNELRIFKDHKEVVSLNEEIDWSKIKDTDLTEKIDISGGYVLEPGKLVIGISEEKLTLPNNLFGIMSGRTRFARLGLVVHTTAQFISPNTENRQVFEIANMGPLTLKLIPGERICQVIFLRCEGDFQKCGTCTRQHSL
ncbi:MAG: dCTP deaminase [Parcubacteria group bacterium GW2011_GWB1_46_8]|nr:MAG: dCTP deaminase [Parcubacteria group bacterium GW2011_GWF1_45_5]KKU11412.1 MAG: dCTP deaminase [Parcubacteria group bacterium GW2011_GWA1_45_7]KKU43397.1 MAG: dCTP deaminase [Parcubacteria group bacterium GW2011_GWA2_46_7]KKU46371.1 MAG: dCTP deaminase [Parcubacteria group bacterium GW2011_GWB1_46_8]KKU47742.1 MAG: dCTP deaminase [Parcubacteria group bacterium GW2011_GWF2_46_8]